MPKKLAGSRNHKPKGRYPWQPRKREPPPKAATNWHRHTEWISGNNLTDPYLPRYQKPKGRGGGSKNPQKFAKHRANDPQRSASSTAYAMQQYTIALQIPRGPPRKSRTVKRKTTGSIGFSLTLPKFYLATLRSFLTFALRILTAHNLWRH